MSNGMNGWLAALLGPVLLRRRWLRGRLKWVLALLVLILFFLFRCATG